MKMYNGLSYATYKFHESISLQITRVDNGPSKNHTTSQSGRGRLSLDRLLASSVQPTYACLSGPFVTDHVLTP